MTIQFKRGTTASTAAYVGAVGEVTVDTDKKALVVHDGVTAGGSPQATPAGIQGQVATAFPSAGAAPAFTLTPSPAITAYAANQRFRVAFNSAGTTGSNTLNISGMGVKNIKQYDSTGAKVAAVVASGQLADVEYDGVDMVILDPLPMASAFSVPIRQTVMDGPVDTAGLPIFLPATSASLSITSQNISASAPFVVASANGYGATGAVGRVGQSTANLTWSGLTASQTNYLYVDVAANGVLTPGFTTVAPVYQFGGTPAVTNNLATFNIQQMQMFVGNGTTAPQTFRVFVGEADTNASTVTATRAYAYQGIYDSGWTATLPGTSVATSKNSNIGVAEFVNADVFFKCTTGDVGYSVGDIISNPSYYSINPGQFTAVQPIYGRNTVSLLSGAAAPGWVVQHKTSFSSTTPTAASWAYKIIARRSW